MLNALKESIKDADSLYFSVSFIKFSGLNLIKEALENALKSKKKIYLITSVYQNFTDIKSLKLFQKWHDEYSNFQIHIDLDDLPDQGGFHTKGYLFENKEKKWVIIGSTNLTYFALMKNQEWNLSVVNDMIFKNVKDAYDQLWNITHLLNYDIIKTYESRLGYAVMKWDMDYERNYKFNLIKPNMMQRKALKELQRYRDMNQDKALVVAATGSGKTHLAAFDFLNSNANKLLFIVHRETILKDAMRTFSEVINKNITFGLLTGQDKDFDADCLFATNITLANHLEFFPRDAFDYIVFDEVHHAKASTYQKIWNYFTPEFKLGLTATPERTDDRESIYSLFENNIPYDLRLREAIENKLIVPFHYYGIRNELLDYSSDDANRIIRDYINYDNIDRIIEELNNHPLSDKRKAIAFCVSRTHSDLMAQKMNERGIPSKSLHGAHSVGERIQTFIDLQEDSHTLEIIFTVDILNEGVDLPKINQVLFLRPTDSSIIFLQQLGRGLRKAENKPYLTVLDFIGNSYKRSVQIIKALSSLSKHPILDKKTMKDLIINDFESLYIEGVKIEIDQLSKEEMLNQLDQTNFNLRKQLEKDYQNFKDYLGLGKHEFPSHMDYIQSDVSPSLTRFINAKIQNKKNKSYYTFLRQIGQIEILLPAIRDEELVIIKTLLRYEKLNINELKDYFKELKENYREDHFLHAIDYLYEASIIAYDQALISLNLSFNDSWFKKHLNDLLDYGLADYSMRYKDHSSALKLYENYRSDDGHPSKQSLCLSKRNQNRKRWNSLYFRSIKKRPFYSRTSEIQ